MLPLEKTITNRFVKKRGLALSIRHMFIGFAATLIIPLIAWLISVQGWRVTCVIAGVVMWIIGLPLAWFFVKQHRPEYYGLLPDGATTEDTTEISQLIDTGAKYAAEVEEIEFTLRQAMRTRAYWLLVVAYASFSIIPPVLVIHAMPFVTDMGIDPVKAGVIIGLMSICGTPGTFIGGFVADRCKKQHLRFLHAGAYFLQIVGFTAFLVRRTLAMVYPLLVLHNLSMAITAPLTGVIIARYFGRKAFGSIRGTIMMFMLPVAVLAPIYAGWVYDTTGNYINVFILCAVLLTFSMIVVSLASPPRLTGQLTDINEIT
jgi:sugar phosphate permease